MDQDAEGVNDLIERGKYKAGDIGRPFFFESIETVEKRKADIEDEIDNSDGVHLRNNEFLKAEEKKEVVEMLFEMWEEGVAGKCKKMEYVLKCAWLMRELEIRHLFRDGNGRASYFGLLSLMAGKRGLGLIMLYNPWILDANGPSKVLFRVIEGKENYNVGGTLKHDRTNGGVELGIFGYEDDAAIYINGRKGWEWVHEEMWGV